MGEFPDPLPRDFYIRDVCIVARDLLGRLLTRREESGILIGRIVETEAYSPDDPGSHSFRGPTRRNRSMYLSGGHAYVYRIYGVHHCFNVVCEAEGIGAAVLIRAVVPLQGITVMRYRRFGMEPPQRALSDGPGKLCEAFGITTETCDGEDLTSGTLVIGAGSPVPDGLVMQGRRVGLGPGKGRELLRRWSLRKEQVSLDFKQ